MLTAQDKKWFQENFAAKKDLSAVRDGFDLLRSKVTMMSLETSNLQADMDSVRASAVRTEEKIDKLLGIMDRQSGRLDTLEQENKMGAVTTARHGRHLQVLAKKVGVKLGS